MHPLVTDVATLKDAELEAKIQNLTKIFFQSQNPGVQEQVRAILDLYTTELRERRVAAWNKQYQKRDKGLDDLIKVR
jgi:hypothetical protein